MFCKHKWAVLHDLVVPSVADNCKELGISASIRGSDFLIRKYRTIITCPTCGKLKIVVTNTYSSD